MSGLPAWAADYIGLPFVEHGRGRDGVDCWGLVRIVLDEQFGVRVPSYVDEYTSAADQDGLGRLIRSRMTAWRKTPSGFERAGNVTLLRVRGAPMHVGVVVAPGWMLHIEEGIDSMVERYDGQRWSKRLIGVYRYQGSEIRDRTSDTDT